MLRSIIVIFFMIIAGMAYLAAVSASLGSIIGLVVWMGIIGAIVEAAFGGGSRERSL
jgi:hypothetical protein